MWKDAVPGKRNHAPARGLVAQMRLAWLAVGTIAVFALRTRCYVFGLAAERQEVVKQCASRRAYKFDGRVGHERRAGMGAGQDHLERDQSIQLRLSRQVDDTHAASAQLTNDLIA